MSASIGFAKQLLWLAPVFAVIGPIPPTTAETWTPMGPWGGYVRNLVIDSDDPRVLYATVDGGGLFKSTDRGDNWESVSPGGGRSVVYPDIPPRRGSRQLPDSLCGVRTPTPANHGWR